MAKVSDFVRDEAMCTISIGDEKAYITYRPSQMTAAATEKLQRYIDERDSLAFARHFAEIVLQWDIEGPVYGDVPVRDEYGDVMYDDDGNEVTERKTIVEVGEIVPLKPNVLQYVPQALLSHVYQELNNDLGPNQTTGRGSRRR